MIYKKRILCDKKTRVDQFKNAYAIMNKTSQQMRIKKQQNLVNRTTQVISSHLQKSEKMSIHYYILNERVLSKQKVSTTIQYCHAQSPFCLPLSRKYSFIPFFTFQELSKHTWNLPPPLLKGGGRIFQKLGHLGEH